MAEETGGDGGTNGTGDTDGTDSGTNGTGSAGAQGTDSGTDTSAGTGTGTGTSANGTDGATEAGSGTEQRDERPRYPGISSRAYEHPADRSALVALRKLTGFDTVFKTLSGMLPERSLRLLFLSDSVRVGEEQFPRLHAMLLDACHTLDLPRVPPMYVTQDPRPNAMCIGLDQPLIVVTTGLVELMDEDELRAVVGHEVGHALSGHAVYRTILLFLTNLAVRVAWVPLGNIAIMGIVTALREWFRKAELSADRAGLLVGGDLDASLRGLMKLAGGNNLHQMSVDAFLAQAAEYEAAGDLRDSVLKILNVLPRSHPFAAVRAAELHAWARSRDYQRLVTGHYPRRAEDGDTSVSDSFRESAGHYAQTVRSSKDPLMKLVTDVAGGASDLGGRLRDFATGRPRPSASRRERPGGAPGGGADHRAAHRHADRDTEGAGPGKDPGKSPGTSPGKSPGNGGGDGTDPR